MAYSASKWKEICSKVHNNFYTYEWSDSDKIRSTSKVPIICPIHGTFHQTIDNHRFGKGCPSCAVIKRSRSNTKSKEHYLTLFKQCHGNRYDYSLIPECPKSSTKITIVCNQHGKFTQTVDSHARGRGCPKCAIESRKKTIENKYGVKSPIQLNISQESRDILLDGQALKELYTEYPSTEIIGDKLNVNAQTVANYLHKYNIPITNQQTSLGEQEIAKFCSTFTEVVTNTRSLIPPKEIDIYLPEYNLTIEYCGLYWHSEQQGKDKWYHYDKMQRCREQGIRLLTIFSDEWLYRTEVVKSTIRHITGRNDDQRIYARNTVAKFITNFEKKSFLDKHHIQGNGRGSINIGLFFNDTIVACMTLIQREKSFVLNRYATNARVIGGFSKALSFFQDHFEWDEIITFADLRWSEGKLYEHLGWEKIKEIPPDYFYSFPGGERRIHKFNFRRKYLPRLLPVFKSELSERENCDANGILRIWDCGKNKYRLTNDK